MAGQQDETNNKLICCVNLLQDEPQQTPATTSPTQEQVFAEARAVWLEEFWFPAQRRKNPSVLFHRNGGRIRIEGNALPDDDDTTRVSQQQTEFESHWHKQVTAALKKIVTEDLGNMDAIALRDSIPEQDADGRGLQDLSKLEKQLSVKVIFSEINQHVLLVGNKAKLEKKCFVIRNMLSHYHWRLSGKDVTFS